MSLDSEENETRQMPSCPNGVRIAAIIWMAWGMLLSLSGVMIAIGSVVHSGCSSILLFLFGLAFVWTGLQTIRGNVESVRGPGFASILFSLLFFFLPTQANVAPGIGLVIVFIVVSLVGAALMLSGILAFIGAESYLRWRTSYRGEG